MPNCTPKANKNTMKKEYKQMSDEEYLLDEEIKEAIRMQNQHQLMANELDNKIRLLRNIRVYIKRAN